ncbi:uncharacterized protein LOC119178419 [Rhipicephalus microplus]|uniref:uncharacterized protein LOC119178419 n=1 Tax=Rhipicephalus microplus TaxID=6941 RepID=UPI003F6CFE1A
MHAAFGFVLICLAGSAICKLGSPGGPMKLPRDSPDGFLTMEKFKHAVAISDSDNDTIFECLSTKRLGIDPQTLTGTYEFLLPSSGHVLLFYVRPGDTPGTITLTSDLDPNPKEGIIYYTDYKDCVVADLELQGDGHQCTLWTRARVKNNIPQDCIDQFVDVCGVVVPAHSRDLCADADDED